MKPNHEVITQALTFVATANAIVYNNAHPIFLDVDIDTMGLSPKAVEAFLEEHGELEKMDVIIKPQEEEFPLVCQCILLVFL